MKIGHKITIIYSAMTLCTAGLILAVIYYWMSDYTDRLYYSFLEERAYLLAQKSLEPSDSTAERTAEYLNRKVDSVTGQLPSQLILDGSKRRTNRRVLSQLLADSQIDSLYHRSLVEFRNGERLGVAIYLPKAEGNIIVVVMSNVHFGNYMHRHLGYWIIGVIGLCGLIILLVSKLYALKRINTLDEAYHREKQFVHHASHELNNPLTAIQGECEIALMKERPAAEYEESLRRISEEGSRMVKTIRQLLYLSSAMDNMPRNEPEPLRLAAFLKRFEGERTTLVCRPEDNDITVKADPQLLEMAIGNIVRNALKYSSAKVEMCLDGSTLTIADHGIGIPGRELAYIGQPFFRATNTRSYQGNGVGMSLATRILGMYGIKMKVRSRVNEGTVVTLSF